MDFQIVTGQDTGLQLNVAVCPSSDLCPLIRVTHLPQFSSHEYTISRPRTIAELQRSNVRGRCGAIAHNETCLHMQTSRQCRVS
jgi:hypothetical protein